jgi:hypothetical protein
MVQGLLNENLLHTQRMLAEHVQETQKVLEDHVEQAERTIDRSMDKLRETASVGPRVIARTYKDANGEHGLNVCYEPLSAPQVEPPKQYRPRPPGAKVSRPSTAPLQRRPMSARPDRWKPEDHGFDAPRNLPGMQGVSESDDYGILE